MSKPTSTQLLQWLVEVFAQCYEYLRSQDYPLSEVIDGLKADLRDLLIVPGRLTTLRSKVATPGAVVDFGDEEMKFNAEFVEVVSKISQELELDELETAKLLVRAQNEAHLRGLSLADAASAVFFQRYKYMLNIVGFLISKKQTGMIWDNDDDAINAILASFTQLYGFLARVNDRIDTQNVSSDVTDLVFIQSVVFVRDEVMECHELLANLLYMTLDLHDRPADATELLKRLFDHIKRHLAQPDILTVHYLPLVMSLIAGSFVGSDDDVGAMHQHFVSLLSCDFTKTGLHTGTVDLTKLGLWGMELVAAVYFLTKFIGWCKQDDSRTAKYDFVADILRPIEGGISYGVMEVLLNYGAETALPTTLEYTYDYRGLLQRQCERLRPVKFEYTGTANLAAAAKAQPAVAPNIELLIDVSRYRPTAQFVNDVVVAYFHDLFKGFVENAAVLLTGLRDHEEDFLLLLKQAAEEAEMEQASPGSTSTSGNGPKSVGTHDSIDVIATQLELERFYLAFTYVYLQRPLLAARLWGNDEDSLDLLGFIGWGLTNNTLALITATFCMLLGLFACGGWQVAVRLWDILVENATMHPHDYTNISVDLIVDLLAYYANALTELVEHDVNEQARRRQQRHKAMFSQNPNRDPPTGPVVIEYAEDAVVFILGFMHLVAQIVANLGGPSPRAAEVRAIAFERFQPVVVRFLALDNLITALCNSASSTNGETDVDGRPLLTSQPYMVVSPANKAVIANLSLVLLTEFGRGLASLSLVHRIWEVVDRWIYHAMASVTNPSPAGTAERRNGPVSLQRKAVGINLGFAANITLFGLAMTFVELVTVLLAAGEPLTPIIGEEEPKSTITSFPLTLPYPLDLGCGYRPQGWLGVWPYIDFIMNELLVKAGNMASVEDSRALLTKIFNCITRSLQLVDWSFLTGMAPLVLAGQAISLDKIVAPENGRAVSFDTFVRAHHSVAVMTSLLSLGPFGAVAKALGDAAAADRCTTRPLTVFKQLLQLQVPFTQSLFPRVRTGDADRVYIPAWVGANGVSSYTELMLFNLDTVVRVALAMGLMDVEEAAVAVEVMMSVAESPQFSGSSSAGLPPLLGANRLLTTLDLVDEQQKIVFGVISQFTSGADCPKLQFDILRWLDRVLIASDGRNATVAHMLLGFDTTGGEFNIPSDNILLRTVLDRLWLNLDLLHQLDCARADHVVIAYEPAQYCALAMAIVVRLCRQRPLADATVRWLNLSSAAVGGISLFEKLVTTYAHVDSWTTWERQRFDGDLSFANNLFVSHDPLTLAFDAFVAFRNHVLTYLLVDIHHHLQHTLQLTSKIQQVLCARPQVLEGSPRVLAWLDVANFKFTNFDMAALDKAASTYNIPTLLDEVSITDGGYLDLTVVDKVLRLEAASHAPQRGGSLLLLVSNPPKCLMVTANNLMVLALSLRPMMLPKASGLSRSANLVLLRQPSQYFDANSAVVPVPSSKTLIPGPGPAPIVLTAQQKALKSVIKNYRIVSITRQLQLESVRAWCQLIEVVALTFVTGKVKNTELSNLANMVAKSGVLRGETIDSSPGIVDNALVKQHSNSDYQLFILEVLQSILPKIHDSLGGDVAVAEELVLLCVGIIDTYSANLAPAGARLLPVFSCCLAGILNLNLTPGLRSDLYVLATKFVHIAVLYPALVADTAALVRSLDKRLIGVIGNDAIYSEGPLRITLILLLEALVHLTTPGPHGEAAAPTSFVLDHLINNNSLQLLVMSIKRTDDMVRMALRGSHKLQSQVHGVISKSCTTNNSSATSAGTGILLNTLVFELVAFKATLYFLIRVAQLRFGALNLIQSELYAVLLLVQFLSIDPDLGLDLAIDTTLDGDAGIHLILDTPLALADLVAKTLPTRTPPGPRPLLYLEFVVPAFQLVSTVLVSMGPNYKPSIILTKELLTQCHTLVVGVMKRDLLIEGNNRAVTEVYSPGSFAKAGLSELVYLFTLLDSLTNP